MPLPLFLLPLVTLPYGIKKGYDAYTDNKKANALNSEAQSIVEKAKQEVEEARKNASESISALGNKKIDILKSSIKIFVEEYGKLKNVDFQNTVGLMELSKVKFDKNDFAELSDAQQMVSSMVAGLGSGVAVGAATAFGAYGATMTFAAASTGTAITTLSGAAATNATLAWLGGGTLAAGGAGVAGGMMVLGGLVAAPALAVFGAIMSSKASVKKEEAYSNRARAQEFAETTKTIVVACSGMSRRANAFRRLLINLDEMLSPLCYSIKRIIRENGIDYSKLCLDDQKTVAETVSIAVAIKAVLDTPILDKDGSLTSESERVLEKTTEFICSKNGETIGDDAERKSSLQIELENPANYRAVYNRLREKGDAKNLYEAGYILEDIDLPAAIIFYNAASCMNHLVARNRLRFLDVFSQTDPDKAVFDGETIKETCSGSLIYNNKNNTEEVPLIQENIVEEGLNEQKVSQEELMRIMWEMYDKKDANALMEAALALEPQDINLAKEFYKKASALGDMSAKVRLSMLDSK